MGTVITKVDTDTVGQLLARDEDKKLYIVNGSDNLLIKEQWSDTAASWLEYSYDWGNGYNKREAVAVEAVTASNGSVTGYKLAIKVSNKNGDSPAQITWDILYLDANGKLNYGYSGPNGQWVQTTVYGVKSIAAYELDVFKQDLNGDGDVGLNKSKLALVTTDKSGVQLAHDTDQGLHVVSVETSSGSEQVSTVKEILVSIESGWLESSYINGADYSKREAVAVIEKADKSGYLISFKNSSKWGGNEAQVTYDLLSFDTNGKQVYGSYANGNTWTDPNVYGAKSLASYESLYSEDLTGDGKIGLQLADLELLTSDKTGIRLAHEKNDKSLHVVEVSGAGSITKVLMTLESGWLENSYINGSDYNKREAIAVVAKSDGNYLISFKNSNKWGGNSEQVTYDLLSFDAKGKQISGGYATPGSGGMWTDPNVYGAKSLMSYEKEYGEDLTGDGYVGVNPDNLDLLATDKVGLRLARDKTDKSLFIVKVDTNGKVTEAVASIESGWLEYSNSYGSDYNKREAIAVVEKADKTGYLISFKSSNKWGANDEQVTYDLLSFDTKGKQVYGGYTNGSAWTDPNVYGAKSLASYEKLYSEDLTGDDKIGIQISDLELLVADKAGVRLARATTDKSLSVVEVGAGESPAITKVLMTLESGWLESSYTYGTDYNTREAIAVVEKADKSGYLVSFKNSSKWGSNDVQVTYDLLSFDANGKQVYGSYATPGGGGAWTDPNVYGAKSLASYESLYKEDLTGDGQIGIQISKLDLLSTDKTGLCLARERDDKSLSIVEVDNSADSPVITKVVMTLESGWLESSYTYGTDYNRREAIAVVEKTDKSGYLISFKNSNKWGGNDVQVTYDLLSFDKNGKQVYGGYATPGGGGAWTDPNVYGAKSLASYEVIYKEDLSGDGYVGINPDNLELITTDRVGLRLAREKTDKSLCIVEVGTDGNISKAVAVIQSGWLENSYTYSSDNYNRREAIAVTQKTDGSYLIAFKNTNKWWGSTEQVSFDLLAFDAQGKQIYGGYAGGASSDPNVYGAKSLTPYEKDFQQDFNDDGFIGVDASKLTPVSTDAKGVLLARDADSSLYLIDNSSGTPNPIAITNGGWLEYSNNWGTGSNSRVAVAVEATTDGSGFKLALKNTNKYDSNPEQITWDILQLDATGRVTYGGMTDGVWKDSSVWGVKSIASYEKLFDQDLNGDGSIGIDVSKLTAVTTDTAGISLMRDGDGGLYLVDGDGGTAVATVIGNAGWIEYNNSWSGGYNKREAIAVEAVKSGTTITGYKLAMKATNKWGENEAQVTWDIIQLDATGMVTYGHMDARTNMWVDETIYGAKSIASYEDLFKQDLNGDGSQGIDVSTLSKVATDTKGVGLRRDRDNALYLVTTVDGVEKPIAVSSSWLEYSNNWGSGSNSREAVAVEANADGTGYRLAMKQTNSWNGGQDINWEVLSLDATGRVSNNYSGSGYLSTRNVNLVEDIVNEDLNSDGQVGVNLSDLQLVITDEGNDRLALHKTDKTLYILDGATIDGANNITAANKKIAVVDSSGMTPQLENTFYTWNGLSAAKVYAVAKQDLGGGNYQYRVAVKVESTVTGSTTKETSWQIYTVSKDGVLDWTQVASSRNPDRFETLFNIDFNNDGKISLALGDLTTVKTDTGSVVLKKDSFGTLYIVDSSPDAANGGVTYLVDSRGGTPTFEKAISGVTSSVYAINQLSDGSYRMAVKNVSTVNGVEKVEWEVHTVTKANANFEASVDWAKVRYLTDVKDVEKLIGQDIDGDNLKGYASETPTTVTGDTGTVTASVDTHGRLYINDNTLPVSPLAVTDEAGVQFVAQRTQQTTESDATVSVFKTAVLAAETIGEDGYKVMVKQTVSDTDKPDVVSYLIYSVTKEGVVKPAPVETPSPLIWESVFKQDFNNDGSDQGVAQDAIVAAVTDTDVGADEFGAVYVKSGNVYVPVLSADGGGLAFANKTVLDGMTIESKPVAAELQASGDYLLAVEVDVTVGAETSTSWAVHTLKVSDSGDSAQWQSAQYYDQASDLTDLFHQNVAVLGA